eukprot:c20429_g1_i1.p1 GENE.c20429_g1_i1~~c20429_g1_i1.p1  ORF type:complete len:1220 (+),score=247.87 c20429_g1_i1:200-3661(+)
MSQNPALVSLPSQIGRLTSLTVFDISNIGVKTLPTEIGRLTALTRLDFGANHVAVIPSQIGRLTALRKFVASQNELRLIPNQLTSLTRLTHLDLSSNRIVGTIPFAFVNNPSLLTLVANNFLTGTLPSASNVIAIRNCLTSGNDLATNQRSLAECAQLVIQTSIARINKERNPSFTITPLVPLLDVNSLVGSAFDVECEAVLTRIRSTETVVARYDCGATPSFAVANELADDIYRMTVRRVLYRNTTRQCARLLGSPVSCLDDACRLTSSSIFGVDCAFDDEFSLPTNFSWTLDTKAPAVSISVDGFNNIPSIVTADSVTFIYSVSELGTNLGQVLQPQQCRNRTFSNSGAEIRVRCGLRRGDTVNAVVLDGVLVDAAGNRNQGTSVASVQRACVPGKFATFSPTTFLGICQDCPAGQFADREGLTICKKCDTCNRVGETVLENHNCTSTSDTICRCADSFAGTPASGCQACPKFHTSAFKKNQTILCSAPALTCHRVDCPTNTVEIATGGCECDIGTEGNVTFHLNNRSYSHNCQDTTPPVISITVDGLQPNARHNRSLIEFTFTVSEPSTFSLASLELTNCGGERQLQVISRTTFRLGCVAVDQNVTRVTVASGSFADSRGFRFNGFEKFELFADLTPPRLQVSLHSLHSRGGEDGQNIAILPLEHEAENETNSLEVSIETSEELAELSIFVNDLPVSVDAVLNRRFVFVGRRQVEQTELLGFVRVLTVGTDLAGNRVTISGTTDGTFVITRCQQGFRKEDKGVCTAVACPLNATGEPDCHCKPGFEGTLRWDTTLQAFEGLCTACLGQQFSGGFVQDNCSSFELPARTVKCQDCSDCALPTIQISSCKPSSDTQCSSVAFGISPLVVAVLHGFIVMVTMYKVNKGRYSVWTHIARFLNGALSLIDLGTDIFFIVFDAREALWVVSLITVILGILAGTAVTITMQYISDRRPEHVKYDNTPTHPVARGICLIACCLNPSLLTGYLEPPPGSDFKRRCECVGVIPLILHDIPQTVTQAIFISVKGGTYTAVLSLVVSVLTIVHDALSLLVFLYTFRKAPKVRTTMRRIPMPGQVGPSVAFFTADVVHKSKSEAVVDESIPAKNRQSVEELEELYQHLELRLLAAEHENNMLKTSLKEIDREKKTPSLERPPA